MRKYGELTRRLLSVLGFAGVFLLVNTLPSYGLLTAHQNVDGCNTCHSLHASPGGTLFAIETDPELLCLSCHGPGGSSSLKVATHNLAGVGSTTDGYITCNECHNSHNNGQESLRTNIDGTYNVKLIGLTLDYNNVGSPLSVASQIREERVATGLGILKDVVYNNSSDYARADSLGVCDACHGLASDPDPIHNVGQDCSGCHAHDGGFAGSGDCRACHDGSGVGAELVSIDSPHSTNTIFASTGETFTCENCHTDHESGNVQIPNNNAVGIMYNSAGHNGISLGADDGNGNDAVGTTEADICWNCHDGFSPAVSEWGLNTDTNGSANNYDHGDISGSIAPAWVNAAGTSGAAWTSGQTEFSYKDGSIGSTHSVNSSVTGPGLDPVASIRCSYCHDVHELNQASGDTTSGAPYLRGSWRGNPYFEDGAPLTTSSYTEQHWGPVPRASTLNNELGGYQIDQNNSYPTAGGTAPTWDSAADTWVWPAGLWTLSDSAGLCALCHTSNVDDMNQFGASSSDWIGTNGHSNAAIGGTGINAVNIFRTSWRAPSGVDTDGANPDMGYANHGAGVGYGFRGTEGRAFRLVPGMDGQLTAKADRPYGGNQYQWGAVVDDSTTEKQYHQFSCSKCHNPHAAKLPRLMITNCLDTKLNTWDDPRADMNAVDVGNSNNNGITLSAATSPDNWGRTWSNTTSAQNCHRLAGDNRATPVPGFGSGWNNVTPW